MATKRRPRRTWGAVRKLPSGRYQASYQGPDGARYNAPSAFDTVAASDAWLAARRVEISGEDWLAPSAARPKREILADYAERWLAGRDIKPRTRQHYGQLLDDHILPTFGTVPLGSITPPAVRSWYDGIDKGSPTMRAHAYSLLKTILGTAVTDDIIPANPCRIRGAASSPKRAVKIAPATLDELAIIVDTVPARYKLMVLLAAWCALRFGEVTELRRKDVDVEAGILHIQRGVVRVDGEVIIGTPKSDAGIRDVAIPPHLIPAVEAHLQDHTGPRGTALLFPAHDGGNMAPASLSKVFYRARDKAGRPDLRFHDLRHTGATLAAATGATLAELMARLGHSTPAAAMRYQHAAQDRDKAIAAALSVLATANPT